MNKSIGSRGPKIILFSNTDWYLYNYRISLARFLRLQGFNVVLMSPPGRYAAYLKNEGFRWIPIQLSRRGTFPLTELFSVFRILLIYLRERPTIVHHFTVKPVLYGSLVAGVLKIPYVVNSITGLGSLFLSDDRTIKITRKLITPIYRYSLQRSNTRVIFENSSDQNTLIAMNFVKPENAHVIQGVGVDLDRFSYVEEMGQPVKVVLASRLLWDKGVREFVDAARTLSAEGVEAKFILVGAPDPGNKSTIPVQEIQDWVNEGVVEWWGHRDDMPEVLKQSHIVTLPSYSEGLPTILLEAAASGRPILATDIPGCRDVVKHNETGILIPLGDQKGYEAALVKLILDPEVRRSMGEKSRRWVEARFDQELINQQTLEVYLKAAQVNPLQADKEEEDVY